MAGGPDYANYTKCMEEIIAGKSQSEILYETKTTSFKYTNVESVALQFRKIFELVVLATLASHQHLFEGLTRKLAKEWQVTKIVAIVKDRTLGFFPNPIDRVPSTNENPKDEWKRSH